VELLLGIALLVLLAWFASWVTQNARAAALYSELKPRLDRLAEDEARLQKQQVEWATKAEANRAAWEAKVEADRKAQEATVAADKAAMETLAREKSKGFPWLAKAYADYFHLLDLRKARFLETKSHPALKAGQRVREIAAKRRDAEKLWRTLKYQLEYYEQLFPWLVDFMGEDLDELVRQLVEGRTEAEGLPEGEIDPARHWLTEAEYNNLTDIEKYQLALDRYWRKRKTKWELGRDYERYVGYAYEALGYRVHYHGIVEGFADLGRDLIAVKDEKVEIVQCKYWSKDKTIHEKHVFQLYGTLVAYRIDHPSSDASAVFMTSTVLSDRAKQFAQALTIRCSERYPLEPYPSVKCNVSRRDGTRIYHLPFDQQYDRTVIEEERLERYVGTVKEAEALGFRRAFRWQGNRLT
jgi:DUF2075 family protein